LRGKAALDLARPIAVAFAVFLLARFAVATAVPWQMAFDDFFYLPETQRWLAAGRLGTDGVFLRVPLWNLLLGANFALFGVAHGLLILQGGIVLTAVACQVVWARRVAPGSRAALWLPLMIFLLSPQILLYSRQAVNELLIGLLSMLLILVGERRGIRAALALGALVGLATMTKLPGVMLGAVALVYVLREASQRAPGLLRLGLGFVAVVLPLVALVVVQRDSWILSNSSAFTLSGISLDAWYAQPDPAARQSHAMALWWAQLAGDPHGYLAGFSTRAGSWLLHPSSEGFALFYSGYPIRWIMAADSFAFIALTGLAALGTRRRDAFLWLLYLGWTVACTFPLATPTTPKIILLFSSVLLATRGVVRLEGGTTESFRQPVGRESSA
jgi:hypothetical protein